MIEIRIQAHTECWHTFVIIIVVTTRYKFHTQFKNRSENEKKSFRFYLNIYIRYILLSTHSFIIYSSFSMAFLHEEYKRHKSFHRKSLNCIHSRFAYMQSSLVQYVMLNAIYLNHWTSELRMKRKSRYEKREI